MAFNVTEIQKQVQLVTGTDGLNSKVITWTNRVLMTLATKAYWQNQTVRNYVSFPAVQTTLTSNLITSALSSLDIINPVRAVQVQMLATAGSVGTYLSQLVQQDVGDLYANSAGAAASTTGPVESYAVARWQSITSGAATQNFVYPELVIFPNASNTTTTGANGGQLQLHSLQAPAAVTAGGDTNWILQKYFSVVLAGVLCRVRLYLGDTQGYLLEKAEFENGIRDMLHAEETVTASSPVLRGTNPEFLNRFS